MKTLTVFTPTYNRAHTLGRTYESLCRQTCDDFEWLIIDDGSTDNTRELVEGWVSDKIIPIRYIYQENQGMHGAHNTAYRNIRTELNTCIDSDDWMLDDSVKLIVEFWKQNGSDAYAGIIGLDQKENGEIIGHQFPEGLKETTLHGYYASGGRGDKKLVYRTEVINKYPEYPRFAGERYFSLGYKYRLIDQDYKMLTINEPLVIVEYQQDGSSRNMLKQYWNNPKGFSYLRIFQMNYSQSWRRKYVICIHYVSHSIRCRNYRFLMDTPMNYLTLLAIMPGIALYFYTWYNVRIGKQQ